MYAPEVDRAEVLRYLGYRAQQPDASTSERIDAMIALCISAARPLWRYRTMALSFQGDAPLLEPGGFALPGRSIAQHLAGAQGCALLAVTLGLDAERTLLIQQRRSLSDALLLDAAMSACIEAAADACCRDLAREAAPAGLRTGARFSPGYGDLPLTCQSLMERLLSMQRHLGIGLTPGCLLVPQKSVTAFVGLYRGKPVSETPGCRSCRKRDACAYRRADAADAPCMRGPTQTKETLDNGLKP